MDCMVVNTKVGGRRNWGMGNFFLLSQRLASGFLSAEGSLEQWFWLRKFHNSMNIYGGLLVSCVVFCLLMGECLTSGGR